MSEISDRFKTLGAEHAPGQELRQKTGHLAEITIGDTIPGIPVDFSHGDVDAFPPTPGAFEAWGKGYAVGGQQAYTEYRGLWKIRQTLAPQLADFTRASIDPNQELIVTPGTQGALFLALGALVSPGDKVAIFDPDYFANRKVVQFLGGEAVPVPLRYHGEDAGNGPDLDHLEQTFRDGARVLIFSNPNNPTGLVCNAETIRIIGALAARYDVSVVVDQLYSRLQYSGVHFTHLRAASVLPENLITLMGPSKTESLSGFRLGVAFGTASIIERMEKLQAIVSLRAAGYNQAALGTWFSEPKGWMDARIAQHQVIRDDLIGIFQEAGLPTAKPQAGSYLFPQLPKLRVDISSFVQLLRVQAGVTVTPGSEFGRQAPNSVRLNFSQDHKAAVGAAHRIVELVVRYRK
jgi:aspartate/methionine/tyrosine aminotransferase